jgi:hypothetical protein
MSRRRRVAAIKRLIQSGRYRVDPGALSDAMIERGNRRLDGEVVGRADEMASAQMRLMHGIFG